MRVESVLGSKSNTTIFDVGNQKMYVLDTKNKEADVWNMAAFTQELSQSVSADSVKHNGKTYRGCGEELATPYQG